ncbi:MAG: hypothetical protein R2705_13600 [Ilumatobacteraceae bacterium]
MSTEQLERLAGPAGRRTTRPARSRGTAVLIASLVLVALAGAAFGVYEYTQAKQGADELDALRTELSMTQAEVAGAEGRLEAAGGQQAALEATLADAEAARDAAGADRDAIAALFPSTPETHRPVPIGGAFTVAATPDLETCTGFSDTAATCVPANFPPTSSCSVRPSEGTRSPAPGSTPCPSPPRASGWSADGAVYDTVANTCGGEPRPPGSRSAWRSRPSPPPMHRERSCRPASPESSRSPASAPISASTPPGPIRRTPANRPDRRADLGSCSPPPTDDRWVAGPGKGADFGPGSMTSL